MKLDLGAPPDPSIGNKVHTALERQETAAKVAEGVGRAMGEVLSVVMALSLNWQRRQPGKADSNSISNRN